jgi:integrase-like protein
MKGQIRPRGKDTWAIIFDVEPDRATGKRRQKWHTFKGSKRDAQREMTRLLAQFDGGEYVEPRRRLVREFLAEWLEHVRTRVSAKTFERYDEIVRCHLSPRLGQFLLFKLTPANIQAYHSAALRFGPRMQTSTKSDWIARRARHNQ